MRDGVSSITNRYRKVKNKYIKSYDRKQELKHIIYLNANNLYSYAMGKFLTTSNFKWMNSELVHKKKRLLDRHQNQTTCHKKSLTTIWW